MSTFVKHMRSEDIKIKMPPKKKQKKPADEIKDDDEIGPVVKVDNYKWHNVQYHLTYKTHVDRLALLEHLKKVFSPAQVTMYSMVHETSKGDNGYDHTHVYLRFDRVLQKTGSRLADYLGIHPHVRAVRRQVHASRIVQYHQKSPVGDVLTHGLEEMPEPGGGNRYAEFLDLARGNQVDVAKQLYPDLYLRFMSQFHMEAMKCNQLQPLTKLNNYFFSGPSNTGKTTLAKKYLMDKYGEYYMLPKNGWWNGYSGQKGVLVDEIRDYHVLRNAGTYLEWCDVAPFEANVKFSSRFVRPETIIFTSNQTMAEVFGHTEYPNALSRITEKRFTVVHMKKKPMEDDAFPDLTTI